MTTLQITLKKSGGDRESFDLTFPDGTVDEARIKLQKDAFCCGVAYICHRSEGDQGVSDKTALTYEVENSNNGEQMQNGPFNKIDKISKSFAGRIERDAELDRRMNEVVAKCTSTTQDASMIISHLGEVLTFINEDAKSATNQAVNFIGFLEYAYQLIKKYIAKMRADGKVGVFLVSVVWALCSFLWTSGILTNKLLWLYKKYTQPSTPFEAIVGVVAEHKTVTAVSVCSLLGLGLLLTGYWYFRK